MFRRYVFSLTLAAALAAAIPTIPCAQAQNHAAQVNLEHQPVAPAVAPHQAISTHLLNTPLRLYPDPGTQPFRFSQLSLGLNAPHQDTQSVVQMDEMKTPFFSQSTFALAQLWSGRVQLDAFQSALHIQNVQPSPGGLRSLHLSGLSLSLHFGRDARASHSAQIWRHLPRMVGSVLD